ncbi:hypothetical protein LMG28614_07042 [Paraburkholderia ultramafica]|uniref:Uncharacterized protein n=1 Tax=Paraburkholderia ultramafica TaxID=1544867 RepID=A0A6S7BR33_9BURK|nr:hypothetical protein LMG28614_07042 [Paraburkholderia ultramafica]
MPYNGVASAFQLFGPDFAYDGILITLIGPRELAKRGDAVGGVSTTCMDREINLGLQDKRRHCAKGRDFSFFGTLSHLYAPLADGRWSSEWCCQG